MMNGCSFTADSGFKKENLYQHWPNIFKQHYDCNLTNLAVGGSSNEEIFYRTLENVSTQQYDLVIIMWSSVNRKWIYHNQNNVDDFTIINNLNLTGFNHSSPEVNKYANLHYRYFANEYIDLKRWLLQINALDRVLKNLNIPHIFIKGFENHLNSISSIKYESGFIGTTDSVKEFLDFKNRPDDYILEKIYALQKLIDIIDQNCWLNFTSEAFADFQTDLADDLSHPGPIANQHLAKNLIDFCQLKKLL